MSRPGGVVNFIRGSTGAAAPDAQLVQRFAFDRDEGAFRALVSRYGPTVWAVCRKVLRDHHDAEDAFQATLLVLARKAGGLRTGAAVGGWLHAVAYRVAVRVRTARRAETTGPDPADHRAGALDALSAREAEAALHEELAGLPEKYRGPLLLCCLDGLSRDEAAARLGWPAARVKHGLERGRELLRARLARRGLALGVPLLLNVLNQSAGAAPPAALVETSVGHATGAEPPAAVSSLANGVTRTMWTAQLKWLAAGCGALVLISGALAAALRTDENPAPGAVARPAPVLVPGAAAPKLKPAEPKKETPKPAWEVATEYLQLIIDGKPKEAEKLGERGAHAQEIVNAELKRAKLAMILINDSRVMVVTERAKLKRRPDAEPTDEHVTVTLERKDATSPWRVIENDVADEKKILRACAEYAEGKFSSPAAKGKNEPGKPKQTWDVATEFLTLAIAGKTAEALKLTPGNMTENKVGEIKERGVSGTTVVAVLLNDDRIEVVYEKQLVAVTRTNKEDSHPVLMLTKSQAERWLVKDLDLRNGERLEDRIRLYLGGKYNTPPKK